MRATETDALVADLIAMLRRIIYLPDTAITAQTPIADLGLDSLDLLEASLELEAALGREMPDGALFDVQTVGDVAARLAGRPRLSLAA